MVFASVWFEHFIYLYFVKVLIQFDFVCIVVIIVSTSFVVFFVVSDIIGIFLFGSPFSRANNVKCSGHVNSLFFLVLSSEGAYRVFSALCKTIVLRAPIIVFNLWLCSYLHNSYMRHKCYKRCVMVLIVLLWWIIDAADHHFLFILLCIVILCFTANFHPFHFA